MIRVENWVRGDLEADHGMSQIEFLPESFVRELLRVRKPQ